MVSVKNLPEKRLSISRWLNATRKEDMAIATTRNLESLFIEFSFGCSLVKDDHIKSMGPPKEEDTDR
jgi:hypothetical protein